MQNLHRELVPQKRSEREKVLLILIGVMVPGNVLLVVVLLLGIVSSAVRVTGKPSALHLGSRLGSYYNCLF